MNNKIEQIKNNSVYKQVMVDSFGGIMYDIANRDKYDKAQVLELWEQCTGQEKSAADGIVKGAINFLQGN